MILDGKKVRDEILKDIKNKITNNNANITLAIIYIGNYKPSEIYINNKMKYCKEVGIKSILYRYEKSNDDEIINLIIKLNNDVNINGIILQSPTPNNINFEKCIKYIHPLKDVDGFTKENLFNLMHNKKGLRPCTAKGIIRLLQYYKIDLEGKDVCIIGKGNIVGKPLIFELLNVGATINICHSKTKYLARKTLNSDIVISAAGQAKLLTVDMVKAGSIIIDVGISVIDDKIVGDVDFDNLVDVCSYITPNPGGIGPMTIAMIIENVYEAYQMQKERM